MSGTTTAPRPTRVAGGAQPTQMPANGEAEAQPVDKSEIKATRTRSPSVAKPAFIVLQVLDEQGMPAPFDKKRVKVLAVERDAGKVLEAIDAGEYTDAFYLRVVVPAGSRAGIPNKPKA